MVDAEWLRIGAGGVVPVHWELSKAGDGGTGTVEGWASVYNVADQQDDVVVPGAFAKTIKDWRAGNRVIALTNGHDNTPTGVIGSVTSLKETSYGLKLAGRYSSAPSAQDVRLKAKEGHIDGLSIFGPIISHSFESRDGRELRIIHEAGLWAVGLTPIPANVKSLVTSAKSAVAGEVDPGDEDPLPEVWICDMKAALTITSKTARKAAVDLLVKTQYPAAGQAVKETDDKGQAGDESASTDDDSSAYALSLIGESGPGTRPPGGEPVDPLADFMASLDAAKTSDDLEALAAEITGQAP